MKTEKLFERLKVPNGVDTKEVDTAKRDVEKVYAIAEALTITDYITLQGAEEFSKACSAHEKKVRLKFDGIMSKQKEAKAAATAAYKAIVDFIDELIGPVVEAKRLSDQKARVYRTEEQRRIDNENEIKRQKAQAEADEKRKAEIAALKEAGTKEAKDAARRLKDEPVEVPQIIEEKLPETIGIVHRELWTCEEDVREGGLNLLVLSVAGNPSLLRFLSPNLVALNSEARTMKGAFKVPGYKAVNKGSTAHTR